MFTPEQRAKNSSRKKKWREANQDKVRAQNETNKEKDRERQKKWVAKNRKMLNAQMRERREAQRIAAGRPKRRPMTPEEKREWQRRWNLKNPGKAAQYVEKWRQENADKVADYQKRYNEKNRELLRIKKQQRDRAKGIKPRGKKMSRAEESRLYRMRHPGKDREDARKRYATPEGREKRNRSGRENTRIRRMRKFNIPGGHTTDEWDALCLRFAHRCVCCGTHHSVRPLARDHIVPITNPLSTDSISNIQPLCQPCNSKKGNRAAIDYRQTPFQGRGQVLMFA